MWSTNDPVTLFGAGMSGRGWDKVCGIFHTIASRWSDCTDQRVEILAAGVSGDLAYTVELEHTSVSIDGVPVEPYTRGSPRSTAAKTASGRSSTATATKSRSTRTSPFPAKHRHRKRSGDTRWSAGRPCRSGATSRPHPTGSPQTTRSYRSASPQLTGGLHQGHRSQRRELRCR